MLSLKAGMYPRPLKAGLPIPCKITWIRLSGAALCKLLLRASDGRLPNSGSAPTSWQTAQAPW